MPLVEQTFRLVCAAWLCACHAYSARRLATAFVARQPLVADTAALVVVALLLGVLDFHLLIATGLFTLPGALLLGTLQGAALHAMTRRQAPLAVQLGRTARAVGRLRRSLGRSPHRGRVYFFAVAAAVLAVRTLLQVPNSHDSVVYHAAKSALWLQEGTLGAMRGPGPFELYGLFPGGGELFTALAILPLHCDLLATAVDFLMWLGMGLGLFASLRELGVREPASSIAASFFLGIPTVRLLVGSSYVEPTMCCSLFLGLSLALRFVRTARAPFAMLAIAALGIAASTKFIAMAPSAAAALAVTLVAVTSRRHASGRSWSIAGIGIALAAVGPWLLLSFAATGHPFSPMPLRILGITLGEGRILEHLMRSAPAMAAFQWQHEWPTLQATFRLPLAPLHESVGVFAALPIALLPLGLGLLLRKRPAQALLLAAATAAAVSTYLSSDMTQVRHGFVYSYSRFLLPLLGIATITALAGFARGRCGRMVAGCLWLGFVVNALTYGAPWLTIHDFTGAGVLGLGLVLWLGAVRVAKAMRAAPASAHAAGAIVLLLLLQQWKTANRYAILRDSTILHAFDRPWLAAAARLDAADARPHTIAITSGADPISVWGSYPLFGTWLQNRVLYVSPLPDGSVPEFWPSNGFEARASYDAWLARLQREQVTDLIAFSQPCLELQWAAQHPEVFEAVDADGAVAHYRLREQ